jgi:hypothetical protein
MSELFATLTLASESLNDARFLSDAASLLDSSIKRLDSRAIVA